MIEDVIVVGGGIIGLAVAFELVAAGRRVRVIEARRPGEGATQASAGMLAPCIEGHDGNGLRDIGRRSLALYEGFVRRVSRDASRHVTFCRCGTIEVAASPDAARTLEAGVARLEAEGVASEWLAPAALQAAEPALASDLAGGLLTPFHGFVAPAELAAALAVALVRQGAIIDAGTRVTAVGRDGASLAVETDNGRWRASTVVLAAGSWSGTVKVEGQAPMPVRPVRGQLVTMATPEPVIHHVLWGPGCYIVPWPDGTVLVGATMEEAGFDERATVAGVGGLLDAAVSLVPALARATFTGVRVGLRPAGADDLPLVGMSRAVPGLVYATGHFRNGLLLTPLTAQLVHTLLDGRDDPALPLLDPARAGL